MALPICLLFWIEGAEKADERPVETLSHAIPLGMVGSSAAPLDTCQSAELLYYSTFKTPALVRMDPLWKTKMADEV